MPIRTKSGERVLWEPTSGACHGSRVFHTLVRHERYGAQSAFNLYVAHSLHNGSLEDISHRYHSFGPDDFGLIHLGHIAHEVAEPLVPLVSSDLLRLGVIPIVGDDWCSFTSELGREWYVDIAMLSTRALSGPAIRKIYRCVDEVRVNVRTSHPDVPCVVQWVGL